MREGPGDVGLDACSGACRAIAARGINPRRSAYLKKRMEILRGKAMDTGTRLKTGPQERPTYLKHGNGSPGLWDQGGKRR